MKIDEDGVTRLEAKLDSLIRLMALSITADLQSIKDKALLLSKAGLAPRDIAVLCDTTPNTVSVALSNARKDGKARSSETKE